jgi:hypothetical protein
MEMRLVLSVLLQRFGLESVAESTIHRNLGDAIAQAGAADAPHGARGRAAAAGARQRARDGRAAR